MPNVRVMPDGNQSIVTTKVNGRTYSCAPGSTIDVPDFDAAVLDVNGWTIVGAGSSALPQVGPTSARPAKPVKNQEFHDTTLGITVNWDGKVWRNPSTGASV